MPMYFNNSKIKDVYFNNSKIRAVYFNGEQVYGYKPNEVLYTNATNGNYDFTPGHSGLYEITIIGAGGGGCGQGADGSSYSAASGSAGGVFVGRIRLKHTDVLNITVGKGGTGRGGGDYTGSADAGGASILKINNTTIATCAGGGAGRTWFRGGSACNPGGACTVAEQSTYSVSTITAATGPTGTHGASSGHYFYCDAPTTLGDYGRGGRAMGASYGYRYEGQNGFDGYVKVQHISL